MNFLRESHNFRHFDDVIVYLRKKPEIIYEGKIYSIIKKPFQSNYPNSPLIDNFYITFSPIVYEKLLLRGMSILYQGFERIIDIIEYYDIDGDNKISKIYLNSVISGDTETMYITVQDIDAILIWRVAYCIENRKPISRL
jgi:hypothetical protein